MYELAAGAQNKKVTSETSAIIMGGVISLVTSLGTSWFIADRYFRRQREIEEEREKQEVQLAFSRLMHAWFAVIQKRPKVSAAAHLAMTEFETRLRIYKPGYDAKEMMEEAAAQAEQFIAEHPNDFEEIPSFEANARVP